MKERLKERLTSNIGLKVISVLLAVLLWFVVVNALDPWETGTVNNIEVEILYPEAITAQGKTFTVTSSQTVSITLEAKMSDWKSIRSSDFRAYVDMRYSYGVDEGNQAARIQIEVVGDKSIINEDTIQFRSSDVLYFTTEDILNRTMPVKIEEEGDLAENYRLNGLEANPSTITVTAPESVMGRVSQVVAKVDRTQLSSDNTQVTVAPVVLDANGNEIKSDEMKLSTSEVTVTASVLRTKAITVTAERVTGTPASGYQYSSLTIDPETVVVMGARSALTDFNHIIISEDELSVDQATGDVVKTVDLSGYLPEGVSFPAGENSTVTVTLHVEQLQTKTYKLPTNQITLENQNSSYEYSISGGPVSVAIIGLQEDLNTLSVGSLAGFADVGGLTPGTYHLTLRLPLEADYTQSGTASVTVVVTDPAAVEPEESTDGGSGESGDSDSSAEGSN